LAGQTFCCLCCFVRSQELRRTFGHARSTRGAPLSPCNLRCSDFTRYRAVSQSNLLCAFGATYLPAMAPSLIQGFLARQRARRQIYNSFALRACVLHHFH
jgi:hypothetical protein